MMAVPMAAGLLVGNPIAGALVRGDDFVNLQVFCGSTVIASGLVLAVGRVFQGQTAVTFKV